MLQQPLFCKWKSSRRFAGCLSSAVVSAGIRSRTQSCLETAARARESVRCALLWRRYLERLKNIPHVWRRNVARANMILKSVHAPSAKKNKPLRKESTLEGSYQIEMWFASVCNIDVKILKSTFDVNKKNFRLQSFLLGNHYNCF